ncbi:MAG: lipid II flippase MurJ, partial [Boseongicola sp.]|nr:lipid II flippase MurJ [Boseongicola sp.]
MTPIRLVRGFMTVGVWTMVSRILGFVRDIMIAAWLGTGAVAEAFLIAFSLPNMFRRFFAEGAFNMAFVPMFSKKLEAGEDANSFARDAMTGLIVILIVLTVLATIFMPWLVLAMASGFSGDERFDIAVTLGRIVFVYILFISLAALVSGVLNASGRFMAAAAAPVLLNVILIVALIWAERGWSSFSVISSSDGNEVHGTLLAFGVVAAGIAQLVLVWFAARAAGFDLRPARPVLTPELKRLAIIAAPAALAGGVVQVNLLIGRQVASFFDGAVAWLSYADR